MADLDDDWSSLLRSWQREIKKIWQEHQDKWEELGLPSIAEASVAEPDGSGVEGLALKAGYDPDPDILGFYRVTNGWPLWLGSSGVSISPLGNVDLFRRSYPDAYSTALEYAPAMREFDGLDVRLSKMDLEGALVLTQPDAREFVLSLRTGETCFFYFDGARLYANFFEYMSYRMLELKRVLLEMLE